MRAWRILPAGDQAVTVEFSDTIDDAVNASVVALSRALRARRIDGITEIVPTYRSLTVGYDPAVLRGDEIGVLLSMLDADTCETEPARTWYLPVAYGEGDNDLEALATSKSLTPSQLIDQHSAARYRVYMIGFAPGYAYLGGLSQTLHAPRRAVPRQRAEPGAVAIGGIQTSVSSVAMPSGWNIIGYTPVQMFDMRREEPFLARAGDFIEFQPVSAREAARLRALAHENRLVLEPC